MPKKIWVISELYYPEETSTGYLLTKIAEGLADHYPVHVLCGQPSYSARGARAPRREARHGVHIQRCVSTTLDKNVLLFKLINFATISVSIFVQALRQIGRNDIVVVVTNPPTLPFLIATACQLRRAKCVLLIHDVYPEVLVAVGKAKQDATLTRLMARLTNKLYSSAEKIIVLGRDMKMLAEKKLTKDQQRVVIIPNWADIDEVTPHPRSHNSLLQKLGITHKFVLQYAGNMGYPNDLASIIESARSLKDRDDIHFLLIGSGSKKRWVEEQIKTHALINVTIVPNQPRSEQQTFLNGCDVAIISLVAGMAGVGVPSRTYNTLAAGKSIIAIADSESEVAHVVQEEQVGWVVPPHQPERLVQAILAAQAQPQRLAEMAARARSAAEQKYSFKTIMEAYLAVVKDIDDSQH